ncbi:MAG: NADH-quinone oxidoreductase subunit N [Solirubrobacteraceae bacterium]|jgi:NADH-quinone oxidoreductase subunit N
MSAFAAAKAPSIDLAGLSPLIALLGGAVVVLVAGLLPGEGVRRRWVPGLALLSLAAALGLTVWQFGEHKSIVSAALAVDDLALLLTVLFIVAAAATILMSRGGDAPEQAGPGEHHALVLSAAGGMALLVSAQNTIALFLGLELLSIPLYVLCATEPSRTTSLESGLKYLIVGSVGSGTLLYGLALVYGATGATDFSAIARSLGTGGLSTNALALTGIALVVAGLAFKASVAPFHQWTPDVYQGAPTPVTAFMAVATKAAAFGVLLRFFDVALIEGAVAWGPALAALATVTIVVGNVGALGQSSLKRLLAWSGVAQAGYLLAGVLVASRLGAEATVFYLVVYLVMNLAAFAVVIARERETDRGDDISALTGIGATRPWLAWPMTVAMLSLAGIPATAGFIGKIYLIDAVVDGGYTWLAVVIVIGSMISLAYYLRIVAAMWLTEAPQPAAAGTARPAMAGGSVEADAAAQSTATVVLAVLFGAATIVLGIIPSPLVELAGSAGRALGLL